jgi:signal transduction histidine kinase
MLQKIVSAISFLFGISTEFTRRVTLLVLVSVLFPLFIVMEYMNSEYKNSQQDYKVEKIGYRHFYVAEQNLYKIADNMQSALSILTSIKKQDYDYSTFLQSTDATFVITLDSQRTILSGQSRFVLSGDQPKDHQIKSGYLITALPGSYEHKKLQQEKAKTVPTILPNLLEGTRWQKSKIIQGCRLSNIPILRQSDQPFGFEILTKADLHCLGIDEQLGNDPRSEKGLVLLVGIPIPKSSKYLVSGILLNNLKGIADHFQQNYGIQFTTLFVDNKAVLTNYIDEKGRLALGRQASNDVVESMHRLGDPYSRWPITIGNKKLFEWYIPLYRDSRSSPSSQVVGIFGYAIDDSIETDMQRMHLIFFSVAILSIFLVLVFKTPLTWLLVKKELEIEQNNCEFEAILSTVSQGIVVLDVHGNIHLANDMALELSGWKNLVNKNVGVLFETEFAGVLLTDLFREDYWRDRIGNAVHLEKGIFTCECTTASLGDNEAFKYLLAFSDITQRLMLEAEQHRLALVDEKNELASEIHDTLAQYFATILWRFEAAMDCDEPEVAQGHFLRAIQTAQIGRRKTYRSIESLKPSSEAFASFWESLETGLIESGKDLPIQVKFLLKGVAHPINPHVGKMLLKICQEAINNSINHSKAKNLEVSVFFSIDHLEIVVQDNGIGFCLDSPLCHDHHGLSSMHHRAREIEAELTITSGIGFGTTIKITVSELLSLLEETI